MRLSRSVDLAGRGSTCGRIPAHHVLLIIILSLGLHGSVAKVPDVGKTMFELVSEKGYAIERHYPVTPDGYILGMFRMPRGKNELEQEARRKPVVYLNHALLDR